MTALPSSLKQTADGTTGVRTRSAVRSRNGSTFTAPSRSLAMTVLVVPKSRA
jgi:hypothetical protein